MSQDSEKIDELVGEIQSLRKEVSDLKKQTRAARGRPVRGVRKRSKTVLLGLPLYDIAIGPDPKKGEMRGIARGIFALGDVAIGVVALGGVAMGGLSFGGLALGVLGAAGGAAVGGIAAGGAAVGLAAFGGVAVGLLAIGGASLSTFTWADLAARLPFLAR